MQMSNSEHFMMIGNPQEFYHELLKILSGERRDCN